MEYSLINRRVSENNVYEISKNKELRQRNKDSSRKDLSSFHNRRASLAQMFFGSNSISYQCNEKSASNVSLSKRRLSKDGLFAVNNNLKYASVPIDSRTQHEFQLDSESGSEKEVETMVSRRLSIGSSVSVFRRNSKIIPRFPFPSSSTSNSHSEMRKVIRCVVVGAKKVGKTAMLQQLVHYQNICNQPYVPTIDDTYQIQTLVDADDRPKELIIFHDTAGVTYFGPLELKRPYIQVADVFILVYSVADHESFNRMDSVKKFIDKQFGKEKKEVPIVVIGTMADLPFRQVDVEFALQWANREKVKLFEISSHDRSSIIDMVHYLSGKLFHPLKETKFSITKRLKPEKSNAQIVMDF